MKNGNSSTPESTAPSSENSDAYKMGPSGSQPLIKTDVDISKMMIEEAREIIQHGYDKDQDIGNIAQLNNRTMLLPKIAYVLGELQGQLGLLVNKVNSLESELKIASESQKNIEGQMGQFVASEQGVNRSIANFCNPSDRQRRQTLAAIEDSEKRVLGKVDEGTEETKHNGLQIDKVQRLIVCADDQIKS